MGTRILGKQKAHDRSHELFRATRGCNVKRDLDLLRNILLKMEALGAGTKRLHQFRCLNDDDAVLTLHIQLLIDAGFIEVTDEVYTGDGTKDFLIQRITFAGYDYLDTVRNDDTWLEIKQRLKKVGESVSLDIVKSLGVAIIKQNLGI